MGERLDVRLDADNSYNIFLENNFSNITKYMANEQIRFYRVCIVTDSHVGPLYAEKLKKELKEYCHKVTVYTFPAGESNKHLDTVQGIYEHLIREGFDRKDMLIALGGGVVGDITGFAAATYLRGIRFIQVPTTLLAQVDSSIGGKTGVDFRGYKNMVGAFYQPSMVYINLDTLATLNDELFACGMAEILKAGLLKDKDYYHWLKEHSEEIQSQDREYLSRMIYRSCEIKKDVVQEDPLEHGIRAYLNLGHTIGHAVEKLMNFTMLHGQCVALGYVAAAYLSLQRGLISTSDLFEIENVNRLYHLPNRLTGLQPETILSATKKDKKMSQGAIKFILLKHMGEAVADMTLTDDEILNGIKYIIEDENHGN